MENLKSIKRREEFFDLQFNKRIVDQMEEEYAFLKSYFCIYIVV